MKVEVYFKLIVGEDKYPSKLTLEIQKDVIKDLTDIDILTYDYLKSLLASDFEIDDILLSE